MLARGARSAVQGTSCSPLLGASASATVTFCPSAETSSTIGTQVEEPQVTIANRRPSSSQAASISSPSTGVVVPESSGSGLLVGVSEPGDDEHPTMSSAAASAADADRTRREGVIMAPEYSERAP